MTDKLVSIVMPTYNCAPFIAETIRSIQTQTYGSWEIVIVDDCSTDNTREIVEEMIKEDPRIKYYCLETNSGAAVARTKSIELCEGEYIAFCDSDDLWMPDKLERQIAFMEENGYAFTCTAYEQIDEESKPLGRIIKTVKKVDYNRLLLDCPVGNSSVMYSQKKLGKFAVPNIRKRNDDALWLTMLKKEKYIWGMPDVLMRYRVRRNSLSSNKLKVIKYHWILYREIEHLNVFRSAFHVCWWGVLKVFRIK